eukprot:1564093-Rhodomonas_salina.3
MEACSGRNKKGGRSKRERAVQGMEACSSGNGGMQFREWRHAVQGIRGMLRRGCGGAPARKAWPTPYRVPTPIVRAGPTQIRVGTISCCKRRR